MIEPGSEQEATFTTLLAQIFSVTPTFNLTGNT